MLKTLQRLTIEEKKRVGYLQTLCNKYGDFKVARAWKNEEGDMCWTKHRSVMECWELGDQGLIFLAQANNRQILPCELIIDLDDNPTLESFDDICTQLEKAGENYKGYHTGSKGFHIHIFNNEFATWSARQRELSRKLIASITHADLMKSSERVMIALEDTPHWKTGNSKTLFRGWPKRETS